RRPSRGGYAAVQTPRRRAGPPRAHPSHARSRGHPGAVAPDDDAGDAIHGLKPSDRATARVARVSAERLANAAGTLIPVDRPTSVTGWQDALAGGRYRAARGLATAIHLAISLDKPLLLEGEAGVGKTEVA